MAIAHAEAAWAASTAHAEPEEHVLEGIPPILAGPISRPGWAKPRTRAERLLRGPLQADRRRIRMEPGGREGIDLQGVEGDSTQDAGARRGTQRREQLAAAVSVPRRAAQALLEPGEPPALLQTCPHLLQGMMPSEHRQEPGRHATATREARRRVRRTASIDARRPVERAYSSQHPRPMGHGTALLNRHRHEAPLLQVF